MDKTEFRKRVNQVPAEEFCDRLLTSAEIEKATGEPLVMLEEVENDETKP